MCHIERSRDAGFFIITPRLRSGLTSSTGECSTVELQGNTSIDIIYQYYEKMLPQPLFLFNLQKHFVAQIVQTTLCGKTQSSILAALTITKTAMITFIK